MHKSKLYDMAGEIAMDKLMPKPIQITISMQGGGGLTGLGDRPLQLAEGSIGSDPYNVQRELAKIRKERYNVKEMSDKKLADKLATEDILRSSISDEDLYKSGLIRVRTRPWAIPQGDAYEERKGAEQDPKTAHIRKLYYLSLKRLLNKVKQNADRKGESFPYEKMQRIIDKGMSETFPEGYAEPIASEYEGEYGMHLEPGDTQAFKDAYSGGGYPGPSFVPNLSGEHGQTAPDKDFFESSYFEEIEDQVQSKKDGGGLSNLNDSININGQPHRLVWANPQEERVLKDMGGSGKEVLGKPAYFDEWSMGGAEAEQQMADVYADVEGAAAPALPVGGYDYDSPSYRQLISPEAQAALPRATTYYQGKTTDTGGLESFRPNPFNIRRIRPVFTKKKRSLELIDTDQVAKEKAEREEQARIRNAIEVKYGTQQLNYPDQPFGDFQAMLEKYKDMYPELLKEYEGQGDIFGAVQKYTNKEAQALLMDAAGISEGEEVSKEQTEKSVNQVLSDELERLEEGFGPELGITDLTKSYQAPPFKPPKTVGGVLKEVTKPIALRLADAAREGIPGLFGIWGTGKINGKGVTIYKDGKIVPFTSDTERYNIESGSLRGENVVPKKLKPRPVQVASAEEVEEEPSPLKKLLDARSEVSPLATERAKMENRVNQYYDRNIFSELA